MERVWVSDEFGEWARRITFIKRYGLTAPLNSSRTMEIEDWNIPSPKAGEVQVQTRMVGICGSDVHGYLGTTGRRIASMVMGHELSGIVSA